MKNYRFEVPGLPSRELSPNARVHWAVRSRAAGDYKGLVYFHALNQLNLEDATRLAGKERIALKRALLDLTFVFKENRRRDRDNLIAMFKAGLDAIRQLGLIEDDSSEHLLIGSVSVEVDAARAPLTIIEIKEIGGQGGITSGTKTGGGDLRKAGGLLQPDGGRRQHPAGERIPQGYRHSGHPR